MPFSKDILMGASGNQGGEFYEHQITRSPRLAVMQIMGLVLHFYQELNHQVLRATEQKKQYHFGLKMVLPPDSDPNQDGVIMTHYDGTSAYEPIKINHYNDPYSNFMVNNKR